MHYRILLPALLALLAGCSSLPQAIRVDKETPLPSYADVRKTPANYTGKTLVVGGLIVTVSNEADHSVIEMLQLPLNSNGRPGTDTSKSAGRFKVRIDAFLDPEIYSNGRYLSVRAQVTGTEDGSIGKHPYEYLILHADGYYLWPDQADEVQVRYYMDNTHYVPYPVYVKPPRPPVSP